MTPIQGGAPKGRQLYSMSLGLPLRQGHPVKSPHNQCFRGRLRGDDSFTLGDQDDRTTMSLVGTRRVQHCVSRLYLGHFLPRLSGLGYREFTQEGPVTISPFAAREGTSAPQWPNVKKMLSSPRSSERA